jgi:hypothetical protein
MNEKLLAVEVIECFRAHEDKQGNLGIEVDVGKLHEILAAALIKARNEALEQARQATFLFGCEHTISSLKTKAAS